MRVLRNDASLHSHSQSLFMNADTTGCAVPRNSHNQNGAYRFCWDSRYCSALSGELLKSPRFHLNSHIDCFPKRLSIVEVFIVDILPLSHSHYCEYADNKHSFLSDYRHGL
jgi:hypothetical protein